MLRGLHIKLGYVFMGWVEAVTLNSVGQYKIIYWVLRPGHKLCEDKERACKYNLE